MESPPRASQWGFLVRWEWVGEEREALVFHALLYVVIDVLEALGKEWISQLWDSVSLIVRMVSWELRITNLDLFQRERGFKA